MRQLISFILSFGLTSAIAHAQATPIHEQVIHVSSSQSSFELSLPANPTTGFNWQVSSMDSTKIKLVKSVYTPASASKHLVGGGGIMHFYFTVLPKLQRPTSTKIELIYVRPWEKVQPAQTRRWVIDIQA